MNDSNSDNSTYCIYCSINNCIMFTHSIGIVTVIGHPIMEDAFGHLEQKCYGCYVIGNSSCKALSNAMFLLLFYQILTI